MKRYGLVSVVIPTMDRPDMVKKCINSVLSGTYKDVEVVVSDDSKDGNTEALLKELKKHFRRTVYIRSKDKSVASAMNKAIRRSSGKFIFLLNDDNTIDKNCIEELVGTLVRRSDVGIVGPLAFYASHRNIIMHAGTLRSKFMRRAVYPHMNEKWSNQIKDGEEMEDFANAFMFRKEVVHEVGMWDLLVPHMGEDGDFEARVRLAGNKVVINPKAMTYHNIPYNPKELYFMRVNRLRMYHGMHSKILYEYRYDHLQGKITFTISIPAYVVYYLYQVARNGRGEKGSMVLSLLSGVFNGIADAALRKQQIGWIR